MASCLKPLKVCQSENDRHDYAFDLTREFAVLWSPLRPFAAAAAVRPNELPGTGVEYLTSADGVTSGEEEPSWPAAVGDEVQDGTLTWQAQAMSFASLRERIISATWTSDVGITISDQSETDHPALQEARIWISGGTPGETYEVVGLIETDIGSQYEGTIRITIQ